MAPGINQQITTYSFPKFFTPGTEFSLKTTFRQTTNYTIKTEGESTVLYPPPFLHKESFKEKEERLRRQVELKSKKKHEESCLKSRKKRKRKK